MKKICWLITGMIISFSAFAQTKTEKDVMNSVQQLTKAMITGDQAQLEYLADDQLTYGHSGGHIENKQEFVEKIVSGKSDFVSINLSNQSITVIGKTAIVRHKLDAVTNDNGVPGETHLLVLLVWINKHKQWKLLARQAVKAG
jgi:hypothetical protein